MFDKEKVKTFIEYDWKNMVEKTTPNNSKSVFNKEEFETIKNGSVIMLISSIVITLCSVFIVASIAASFFNIDGLKIIKSCFGIASNMGSTALIPIIILVYMYIFKEKEHTSFVEFIAGIVLLVIGIFYCVSTVAWVAAMFINPVWALLGMLAQISFIYGIISVMNGIIPFCIRLGGKGSNDKETKPKETKGEKIENVKYCASCGTKATGAYCTNCGKKIK